MISNEPEQLLQLKQELMHRAVTFFEDAPCYPLDEILSLQYLHRQLYDVKKTDDLQNLLSTYQNEMNKLKQKKDAPKRIYLWTEGNMPSLNQYIENPNFQYNHDPDFKPYMFALTIPEDIQPKGAIVVCAGGDHGDSTLHEGYQTCLDMNKLGYQCFLLLNRTNRCPFDGKEAGADAARALQIVRRDAALYRIEEHKVAFAGFSNGGLTAEACIQYFSGTQKINTHFPDYKEEILDSYYGSPDAVVCVYGPRFHNADFDYTNVVYPPVFFAVGRDDSAMNNLNATVPDLLAHHVEIEVHTFSGVPHGQSGITIYGENRYPHFQLWLPLADAFLVNVFSKSVVKRRPDVIQDLKYRFDTFQDGSVLLEKKKGHLPPMGWNSWNAFGSGNTEALTKAMADAIVELDLDAYGYQYVVLDDGCYRPVRENGKLVSETRKFPSGFHNISDYIHSKGLKFGMYNDIGTNLCSGLAVGTCGHEDIDAKSYIDWGVDFLKVDNCYYPWDNATFSNSDNAKYVYAPKIRGIRLLGFDYQIELNAVKDGILLGNGIEVKDDYVYNIGTFDGTSPEHSPVGMESGELVFSVNVPAKGEYHLFVNYASGQESGIGNWLQLAVGEGCETKFFFDDFLKSSGSKDMFIDSDEITLMLNAGENRIRLMNHRRQENTLCSYAALLSELNKCDTNHDIIYSICEWGKTQPQNWGYKVGDTWRILNDITFRVGSDGNPGYGSWTDGYTPSVTSQYNKAVIMDEFSGLDKGWNDPDMLMIGMNGLTDSMMKTHMAMWCMMNAPLMLGLDLRRVKKGDFLWKIISNKALIDLNQDALGIQAKRVYTSIPSESPDTDYIRDNNRVDILVKPLSDGSIAISFINVSEEIKDGDYSVSVETIIRMLGHKMVNTSDFHQAKKFKVLNLWTGENVETNSGSFCVKHLAACDNISIRVTPLIS